MKNILKKILNKKKTKKVVKKKAKVITSISMFYDLESPITFAQDVYECLGSK